MLIASTKRGHEPRHILVALQSAKTLHGFEDGSRGPSERHVPPTPPFDVPLHMPRTADETFDRVGRRERLSEAIGQTKCEDGEGIVEAFTDARCGTEISLLESSREILQETPSRGDVDLLGGARDDRARPEPLPLRQMLQDVAELVHLTAVHQGRGSKRLRHGLVQRLRAIEDDQETAVGAQPAAPEIGQEALTHGGVFRGPIPEVECVFCARMIDPKRNDEAVLADVHAVESAAPLGREH